MKKLHFIVAVGLVGSINYTYSQNSYNISTTAVPFLRISTDAQAGGMGDAGIATTANLNSVYWNPGKLTFAEKKAGVGGNYVPWSF